MSTAPENLVSEKVIAAALEVHRALGPGLLENTYEECLAYELSLRNISFVRQQPLPIVYKDLEIAAALRLDFMIEGLIVVEIKAIESILPVHQAQVMTYLKMTRKRLGLLIDFNVPLLKNGIKRVANGMPD